MSTTQTTRATIFLRLKSDDTSTREIAWSDFRARYAPVIAGFAIKLGVKTQDIDDIIQDVMLGFFAASPTFVYDPSKGRFRSYLKVCTMRVLRDRAGKTARLRSVPLDQATDDSIEFDQIWNDVWEQELLKRALDVARLHRTLALHLDAQRDRAFAGEADQDPLHVEDDVDDVLEDALERGELVEHAVDLDLRDGEALDQPLRRLGEIRRDGDQRRFGLRGARAQEQCQREGEANHHNSSPAVKAAASRVRGAWKKSAAGARSRTPFTSTT